MANEDKKPPQHGRTWADFVSELFAGAPGWVISLALAGIAGVYVYAVLGLAECRELGFLGRAGPCEISNAPSVEELKTALLEDPEAVEILRAETVDVEELKTAFLNDPIAIGVLSGQDGTNADLPTGTVAAFDRDYKSESACPEGWDYYEPAGGRFIIGAGEHNNKWFDNISGEAKAIKIYQGYSQEKYTGRIGTIDSRATGGAEVHSLTPDEMPRHRHGLTHQGSDYSVDYPGPGNAIGVTRTIGSVNTDLSGGGKPHNNMPPYIALYFCKKT